MEQSAPREQPVLLKPLPQFSVGIPEGWKDALYGLDGSASTDAYGEN